MFNQRTKTRIEPWHKSSHNIYIYIYSWAFLILLLPTALFLFWKCRYGFANMDESFYLTIPLRLLQGDGLLLHEWHVSQLASVLLLPFVAVYKLFSADNEGLLLAFRYLCTAAQLLTAVFVYFRMRKISPVAALVAALGFAVYTPFGVMALSYNSMGIIAMTLCGTIWLTAEKYRRGQLFVAGIFFAAAVLCCPYLVIGYALFSAASLVRWVKNKKEKTGTGDAGDWLWISAGAAFSAILFCVFLLSRASLSRIIAVLPYVMNDAEHPNRGAMKVIWTYITAIFTCNGKWSFLSISGYLVLTVAALADRKRKFSSQIFLAAGFLTAVYAFSFLRHCRQLNFQMFPLNMFALICWLISDDDRINKLMYCVWLPGMIYSFCIHYASNQEFAAISSASTAAFIGSVPIVVLTAQRLFCQERRRIIRTSILAGTCLLMIFQLGAEFALRYNTVFWESGMAEQRFEIDHGPEKGLLVSEERQALYDESVLALEHIPEYAAAESVTFVSDKTWLYLVSDKEYGTYSAWLGEVNNSSVQKLSDYFKLFPEKIPDVILVEPEYEQYISVLCCADDFSLKSTGQWIVLYHL